MDIKKTESCIEGILFIAGEAVSIDALSEVLEIDKKTLKAIIKKMIDYYNFERRGLQIIEIDNYIQLCTHPEYYEYINKMAKPRHSQGLSSAAFETLAIVAYNQPVTRSNIEHIRGVNSDKVLNTLIERDLVEEIGRLDAPGRPILFKTTKHFLRCFGFSSIDDLPKLDQTDEMEQMEISEQEISEQEISGQELETKGMESLEYGEYPK